MSHRKKPPPKAAFATPYSENRKTGPVAVTYASQESCPTTCPLLNCGCYAEAGPVGAQTAKLNAASTGLTPAEIATQEALSIDRLPRGSDIRIHVVGDCRTDAAAGIVAHATKRYLEQSRGVSFYGPSGMARERFEDRVRAWGYTHAWRLVKRESWGVVSMLASCETWADVDNAWARGYAAAVLLPEFENGTRAWQVEDDGGGNRYTVIPCVFQTKGVQCVDCRLCLDDQKLRENRQVIAFKAHGNRRESVVRTLEVLNNGS